MELTSFGSVMKFAIDREGDVKAALGRAAADPKFSAFAEKIKTMSLQNESNLKTLERTRRENINEVVLYPITGLDDSKYLFDARDSAEITEESFLKMIEAMSEKLSGYYAEAAEKLHTDDAKRIFQRLAKKKYL